MSSGADPTRTVRVLEAVRLIEALERRGGVATRQELDQEGFSHRSIAAAVAGQSLIRAARGLYRLPGLNPYGESALASATLLFPTSVVALISALAHHGLTTQIPATIDLAVPRRYARETADLTIRQVVMPMRLILDGVLRIRSGGFRYRVFSRERSVCDAFRFISLVGEEIAYESLRSYLRDETFSAKALLRAAEITETTSIIVPVMKTLQAS